MTVNAIQNSLRYPATDQPFNRFNASDRFNKWCNLIILITGIFFQLNSRTMASDVFICLGSPTQEIPIYSSSNGCESNETPAFTFPCLPLDVALDSAPGNPRITLLTTVNSCAESGFDLSKEDLFLVDFPDQCTTSQLINGLYLTPEPAKAAFGKCHEHNHLDPKLYLCNATLVDIKQFADCTFYIHSGTGCLEEDSNPVLSKLSELAKAWPNVQLSSAYNHVKTQDKCNPLLSSIFMAGIPPSCAEKTTRITASSLKEFINDDSIQPSIRKNSKTPALTTWQPA